MKKLSKADIKDMFRALSVKNYRYFFIGQGISLIGTWIQRTTMGWYVYRLTNSVFLLGLISFLSMIPSVFISPFAGAWADRWNRHKILIFTQIAFFIQASLLAIAATSEFVNSERLWPLVVLALMQGVIEAIDAPTRQTFVIDMVKIRSLLPNAIAMNSAMFNGARLFGPAIGGFVIVAFGEYVCFAFNALSYIPVIIMLFLMNIEYVPKPQSAESTIHKIVEGWKYTWQQFPVRYLVMNIAVYTLFGMSYATLLPVFARDILKGNSSTMGLMMSTAGIGALSGSLYLASRKSIKGLPNVMMTVGIIVSSTLIVFAFSPTLYLSMPLMVIIGLGMMMQMASTNTIIQSVVEDKMRGRVLSIYTMAFGSVTPFGSLLTGSLSSKVGVQFTLVICAGICLLWSLSGLTLLGKFNKRIFRMLISSNNTEIYRPKAAVHKLKESGLNESI